MKEVALGEVFDLIRNGLSIKQDQDAGGLPITRIETIANSDINVERVGYAGVQLGQKNAWLLQKDDILFSHINSLNHLGKCAIYKGEPEHLVHGMNLLAMRCNQAAHPAFVLHILRSSLFRNRLLSIVNQSVNQVSVSIGNLKDIEIPLPPLAEQKRLAAILDRADELRRLHRQVLARLDELAQSLFLELFGDPATNPKGWDVVKLGDVCLQKGKYGANAAATEFKPELPRYIRITDIDENGDLKSTKVSLSSPDWEDYVLKAGDLLFARSGATVGKTYLVKASDGLCAYAGYLIRFQVDPAKLHSIYASEFTRSEHYARWVGLRQNVVAQPNINAKQYADLEIPLPPLALQRTFAAQIEELEAVKGRARDAALEADALFASLQSRAFAGELSGGAASST